MNTTTVTNNKINYTRNYTWNVKIKVIPVIIGANDTISKSFRKYLSNVSGKHDIKELHYREQPFWALRTYFENY
jgi:hypothetical protein